MMSVDETGMIRKGSAEEIVAKRDRAIEMYQKSRDLWREAMEIQKDAAQSDYAYVSMEIERRSYSADDENEHIRKNVDRSIWRYLVDAMGFRSLMDTKAIEKFEQDLENPPEVTVDNIYATLSGLNLQKRDVFRRGLVNVFRGLSRDYRSNGAFSLGSRIVLRYAVDSWYLNKRSDLDDVDRIFHILDGMAPPDHRGGLAASVTEAIREKKREAETPYFRAVWYKNRNMHLYFKRQDLVDAANRLIAEECGQTLAHAR